MPPAPKVLIVEDEVLIAMYVEMELKRTGYEVSLMDIRSAGEIDGIEAARQIQACYPIPIIFMTRYPDKDVEERAKALNPLGFFTRPVSMPVIKPLLDSITTAD